MFGFLSGPLILYDRQISDSPNNDCGEVAGRLLNARDAGPVLATLIFLHENECDKHNPSHAIYTCSLSAL